MKSIRPPEAAEPDSPAGQDPVRIYRRVCLLRVQGDEAEAGRLEAGELAGSLAAATASGRLSPGDWRGLAAREDERVVDAQTLAELLAPLLAGRLPAAPAAVPSASRPEPRPISGAPPTITDLIDDMLRLQRLEARSAPRPS